MTCIRTMAERFIRCAIRGYSDSAVWHKKTMMIFIPPQMKPVYMGYKEGIIILASGYSNRIFDLSISTE